MNIHEITSTEERERILSYLLQHQPKEINMNRIAKELGLSPGQIHKYINILRRNRILGGTGISDTPLVRVLRITDNIFKIEDSKLIQEIRKSIRDTKGIGMYGSWAEGTNTETSDLDIWIKTEHEPEDIELAKLRRKLEKKLGSKVDMIILTKDRLSRLREKSDSFYFSLYYSMTLWGERL